MVHGPVRVHAKFVKKLTVLLIVPNFLMERWQILYCYSDHIFIYVHQISNICTQHFHFFIFKDIANIPC